ncbi:MAG: glycosyltransferase [Methanosarcinales archaeon]|nr:glycosyltransferase [Methanosarcinales archaeon]
MISVIVPSLNEAATIGSCLQSIANQSVGRDGYEIIVVDGDSQDGTPDIARRYADRVIAQSSKGIGGSRRDGADAARGDILAFTDADTIVPHAWLERIEANLADHDASTGPVIYVDADLRAELLQKWRDLYRVFHALSFYYIIGSNMAVRREVYQKIGGHRDISLLDDYDLSVRLMRIGAHSVYDPEQMVFTSSRRADRLLTYAITVAYGHYHYMVTRDHEKLLNYPKPEEMTLKSLIHSQGPSLDSIRTAVESVHTYLEKIKKGL